MDSNSGLIISQKNTCYCKGFIVIFTKEYVRKYNPSTRKYYSKPLQCNLNTCYWKESRTKFNKTALLKWRHLLAVIFLKHEIGDMSCNLLV